MNRDALGMGVGSVGALLMGGYVAMTTAFHSIPSISDGSAGTGTPERDWRDRLMPLHLSCSRLLCSLLVVIREIGRSKEQKERRGGLGYKLKREGKGRTPFMVFDALLVMGESKKRIGTKAGN